MYPLPAYTLIPGESSSAEYIVIMLPGAEGGGPEAPDLAAAALRALRALAVLGRLDVASWREGGGVWSASAVE